MMNFALLYLCISCVTALKLQQDPELEIANATYDEECGDRNNYKCWKKGGHSVDKDENSAIIRIYADVASQDCDATTATTGPWDLTVKGNGLHKGSTMEYAKCYTFYGESTAALTELAQISANGFTTAAKSFKLTCSSAAIALSQYPNANCGGSVVSQAIDTDAKFEAVAANTCITQSTNNAAYKANFAFPITCA
jgi:hypothetical protein